MAKKSHKRRIKKTPAPRIKARKPRGLKPKRPAKSLKLKSGATVRRNAKRLTKAATAGKPFKGGLTKQIGKAIRKVKKLFKRKPVRVSEKEKRLKKIGIAPYKSIRKRTPKQTRKINKLYSEFSEFATARKDNFAVLKTKNKRLIEKARKSGMAIYDGAIYVYLGKRGGSARAGRFMLEDVIRKKYYGKTANMFVGGADVFDRVVKKLESAPLKPTQMITGSFFGGPHFYDAIYNNIGDFLNYLDTQFVPHLPAGTRASKQNLAKAKAALIKNLSIIEIDNPQFMTDERTGKRIAKPKRKPATKKKTAPKKPAAKKKTLKSPRRIKGEQKVYKLMTHKEIKRAVKRKAPTHDKKKAPAKTRRNRR